MSVEAMSWAMRQRVGGQGPKFLLVTIANHASKAGVGFVGRELLARECECRPETITEHMKRLERAGLLRRFQRRRENGSRTSDWLVLAPAMRDRGEMVDAAHADESYPSEVAAAACRQGEDPSPGDSSGEVEGGGQVRNSGGPEPSEEPSEVGGEPARPREDFPPDDFPEELLPHLRAALKVLRDLARRHGARKVTALSLGNVIAARPHKPIVKAAHDYAAWADSRAHPRKDVTAGYRNWLDRCDDLAGFEPPLGAPPRPGAPQSPSGPQGGALRAFAERMARQDAAGGTS